MSEMKRPKELEMYGGNGLRRSVYLKYDADAYIAALERRARIADRALELLWDGIIDCTLSAEQAKEDAEREIDSEQKESGI